MASFSCRDHCAVPQWIAAMKWLSRAVTFKPSASAARALASRRSAAPAKAGSMSAYFFTRSRMVAKSAAASVPQAALR